MAEEILLTLPVPPSINNYYATVTLKGKPRRIVSAEGRRFREQVNNACLLSRVRTMGAARLTLDITLFFASARRSDISNRIKALEDALKPGAYVDDEQIDLLIVRRGGVDRANPRCIVRLSTRAGVSP